MTCAPSGSTRTVAFLLVLLLALGQDPAIAARPWQEARDKPGNGNSKRWHGNTAPSISGTPASIAEVEQFYAFQPSAVDPDGDTLVFSITNKPAWAAFDSAHGYLSGYPSQADAGTETLNIVISVSDGTRTTSLAPFAILVPLRAENLPPVISGIPAGEAVAGQAYDFAPSATDPEGESLLFRIANRPAWATFDSATGRLRGTPDSSDVGIYEGIRISVSDGTSSASTPDFSIAVVETATGSVTLNWSAPTQNVDGTPVLDLAGYRIHYGTAERQYDHSISIDNPGITTTVVENLGVGTWYFAATATTASGLESEPSAEVVRVVE